MQDAGPDPETQRMSTHRPSTADKRRQFHALHTSGCFVIPNPWDLGSARMLQGLGFKALASTSSGFAWSQGHPDNGITRADGAAPPGRTGRWPPTCR
jgi:2-methylisocitrate lyase-like PEP mutase family enzyme